MKYTHQHLMEMIYKDCFYQLKYIALSGNIDIEMKNSCGKTALHIAVMSGKLKATRALIESGADINATDTFGWTPLHWAAFTGRNEAIEMLLSAGADLEAKNHDNLSPLYCASCTKSIDTVKLLLAQGAQIHANNEDVVLSLFYASSFMGDKSIKVLSDQGKASFESKAVKYLPYQSLEQTNNIEKPQANRTKYSHNILESSLKEKIREIRNKHALGRKAESSNCIRL